MANRKFTPPVGGTENVFILGIPPSRGGLQKNPPHWGGFTPSCHLFVLIHFLVAIIYGSFGGIMGLIIFSIGKFGAFLGSSTVLFSTAQELALTSRCVCSDLFWKMILHFVSP